MGIAVSIVKVWTLALRRGCRSSPWLRLRREKSWFKRRGLLLLSFWKIELYQRQPLWCPCSCSLCGQIETTTYCFCWIDLTEFDLRRFGRIGSWNQGHRTKSWSFAILPRKSDCHWVSSWRRCRRQQCAPLTLLWSCSPLGRILHFVVMGWDRSVYPRIHCPCW
jgi:hypothetical protein